MPRGSRFIELLAQDPMRVGRREPRFELILHGPNMVHLIAREEALPALTPLGHHQAVPLLPGPKRADRYAEHPGNGTDAEKRARSHRR